MERIKGMLSKVITEPGKDLETVGEEDNLLEIGMNSLNFIHLVLEMEKEFQVFVDNEDLVIENFDTIAKIQSYISANS